MKITTLILLIALMQVSAASVAQRITFVKKNASLEQVFQEITRQTGYEVFYGDKKFDDSRKINVAFKDATLDEVLKTCLQYQRASYVIEEKSIIIKPSAESTFLERLVDRWAAIDVHGRVVDQEGKPLPGATVKFKGTGKSVSANAKGEFYLEKVEEETILVISFIGYVSKEVSAAKEMGNIMLEVSDSKLDEVQVIAYGETTKRLGTGNVGTVKAEDIAKQPINNPLYALQGQVSGLQVIPTSGLPGAKVNVRLRGQNTINSTGEPLFVIDGLPYTNNIIGLDPNGASGLLETSLFNLINPNEIESISILKDADATSIYGSRGSNGVILITTKKGRDGTAAIDLNMQSGVGKVSNMLKLMNTAQYLSMRKEGFINSNLDYQTLPLSTANADLKLWDQSRYTDWQKQLIGKASHFTDLQGAISGGTSMIQYRISGTFHRETTVFPGDFADQKASVKFSLTGTSGNQKFKTTLTAEYLNDNNELPGRDFTSISAKLSPNAPPLYDKYGELNWEPNPVTGRATWTNPYASLLEKYKQNLKNLTSSADLSYKILPSLILKTTLGYSEIHGSSFRGTPLTVFDPGLVALYPTIGLDPNTLRRALTAGTATQNFSVEPQVTYSVHISKGKLDALAGASFQNSTNERSSITLTDFASDAFLESQGSAANVEYKVNSSSQYKYVAFYGRLTYNWDQKYLLNLTGRRDGSSRFGPENRFGNFGSIGAGWIFSQEKFLQENVSIISYGKLRISYGITGNDNIGDYKYFESYSYDAGGNVYQGIKPLISSGLVNPYYRWESVKKLETALETGFFKDRILLSIVRFQNGSTNQLTGLILPITSGQGSLLANAPFRTRNSGWELDLRTDNIKAKEFSWSSSFNLTFNTKNKVLAVPSNYPVNVVGLPFYGITALYTYKGLDPASGEHMFLDKNNNLTTTPDTTVNISTTPKFYGGLANRLSYRSLSLDIFIQFTKQIGRNFIYDYNSAGRLPQNQPVEMLNRWQNPGDIASFQAYKASGDISLNQYLANSTGSLVDASFIRVKNISLSYSVPSKWSQRFSLNGLRVYLQGQNLWTFTKYRGFDPETQGISSLPPLRVITAGIQLTL